jgi:hypothetical protein
MGFHTAEVLQMGGMESFTMLMKVCAGSCGCHRITEPLIPLAAVACHSHCGLLVAQPRPYESIHSVSLFKHLFDTLFYFSIQGYPRFRHPVVSDVSWS